MEYEDDAPPVIDWPFAVLWATANGNGAPTLAARRGLRDILAFYYDGASYIGSEYARAVPVARQSPNP